MYNCIFYTWGSWCDKSFSMVIADAMRDTVPVFVGHNLEAWEVGQLMGGN